MAKINYEIERILLGSPRAWHNLVGVGMSVGTVDADLRMATYNATKTQFFVPVGSSVSTLGNDGLFGGQLYGETGVSTRFGDISFLIELFILQTGALTGGTSTSTGVTLGMEWSFGNRGDLDGDGRVDMDDLRVWQARR